MKSYEEVTKDVLRRSKEEIIKREKRRSRMLKAAGASAVCFALVGAVGLGIWANSRQNLNIVLSTDSTVDSPSAENTAVETSNAVSTAAAESPAADPFELLNCSADENGNYKFKSTEWKKSEDYDRYRDYFFGTWEGEFTYLNKEPHEQLVIDDSEKSYLAAERDCWFDGFYEVNDHVLAFIYSTSAGISVHWTDTDTPSFMYVASIKNPQAADDSDTVFDALSAISNDETNNEISIAENDLIFSDTKQKAKVYTLTKTIIVPSKPENGFLSTFKLYEMARDYGIDINDLVDIKFDADKGGDPFFSHDAKADSYPIYLLSESPERLVLAAKISNIFGFEEMSAINILEKIDGEWKRTGMFFSECHDVPSDYGIFDEYAVDYCHHTMIGSDTAKGIDTDVIPKNGTVYISKPLQEAMDFYGDKFNDGCFACYRIKVAYFKDGESIVPTQGLFYSEMERLEYVKQLGLDKNGYSIPGQFSYSCFGSDWGQNVEYGIYADLSKKQLENFTASEDYGIALYLDDSEIGSYQSDINAAISEKQRESGLYGSPDPDSSENQ